MPLPCLVVWLSPPLRTGLACRVMPLPCLAVWLSPPLRTGLACRAMPLPCLVVWLSPTLRIGLAWHSSPAMLIEMGAYLERDSRSDYTPAIIKFLIKDGEIKGGGGGGLTYSLANTVLQKHSSCFNREVFSGKRGPSTSSTNPPQRWVAIYIASRS